MFKALYSHLTVITEFSSYKFPNFLDKIESFWKRAFERAG